MAGVFLDTNIFLRHLLDDEPVQSPACNTLFRQIERGTLIAWTSPLVIAEVVFVLSNPRTYDVDRTAIRDSVLPLINLPGLKIERKRLYPRVFALYTSLSIDYVDAHHAALLMYREEDTLYSYDVHFDRVPEIRRRAP